MARRVREDGTRLPDIDDKWWVGRVTDDVIELKNERTRHIIELGLDNVKNFQTPDFLILQYQITIGLSGNRVDIEPLIPTRIPKPTPEEVLIRAVLDSIPAIPGSWGMGLEKIVADPDARQRWFAQRQLDAHGGVLLPIPGAKVEDPWTPCIAIPLALLRKAQKIVEERKRAEMFHPLDE